MAEYKWPEEGKRTHIGKRISRLDGPDKVSGRAKYTFDINRPGMLFGKVLRSPHAHAKIVSIDTSGAEKLVGKDNIKIIQGPGAEIQWAGDEIAVVAAKTEGLAEDAMRAIKVTYEKLPHFVNEQNWDTIPEANRRKPSENIAGDPAKAFQEAEVVLEGTYGNEVITHCCLESHGLVAEWEDDTHLLVHQSTQSVSANGGEFARELKLPAGNVRIKMDHVGGGFGSKFPVDRWGFEAAKLSKQVGGKPIKLMLERDSELMVAGTRPSAFAKVKVGAKKDGTLVAWESQAWGSGGVGNFSFANQLPYVMKIADRKETFSVIPTNTGPQRAWRAPNHPQACLITMAAFEDMAAKLNMDPLEFFLKNIGLAGARQNVYRDELMKAAELIEWKKLWRPRGEGAVGSTKTIKRGLGLSLHTWGGGGHASDCDLTVHPDGSVEVKMGTQDLGVGTRTVLAIVAADTFAIPLNMVKVHIGDNRYPVSGGSGGSTTVGGISSSTRRASVDALNVLLEKVAPAMNTTPDKLEAVGGKIQEIGKPTNAMTWQQACAKLGTQPLTTRGKNPGKETLTTGGVGGVQMADVSVDIETGVVKMNNFVAVQDCGLIIDMKTCESQVFGAMIMGVTYALYEERVMDDQTGKMLNPNMEFYKLAGLRDIGNFKVHMMTGKGYDERGVIGIGEPPTVSPGAAISNAVANAIGVRVPSIPLTADRVLAALAKKGGKAS
ncbi:MAG TPA: xanthine dehydrogenase family protein molybdopterin-binding subunit [Blastocatellia bacterium]|nr:xanthine dehydrogenase family protein molybdopterin-binding subunit [Blastocatellia bacterium]HMV84752.1 xanthine dehydrogenase family protein molybdopterin-binding subunit [Blastocatellia bacterium]HMY70236.1 xanthine dehydrogenase family protein molybdopterin-binding subunit [Blastocatellia bacterium]HMZ22804.1 xanthine dehydrogenase family protein molybdopterin-binding subunit [Blastocatellia bacterium]HNG30481.1 xanthine dehydrogenase family protein molybdopterin-binding subunit [Blastoc